MSFKRIFLAAFLLAATLSLHAQHAPDNWCGYTGKSPWLVWYQAHRDELSSTRDLDTNWLYVPVTVQIVGKDNGTGYFQANSAIRAICDMNDRYQEAHIRFYLKPGDPFRYLNNSAWYEHDWDGGAELIQTNRIPGRLNAFVVSDPAGNCGYSWQDAIVLGKGCSGAGNTTWSHEAGHHLSLPHPFFGWEGFDWNYNEPAPEETNGHEVEKVDGSNCDFAGDGFCDTPPDYLNYRWNCNDEKLSTTQQTDPNGAVFHSDASIIMGYALDACASRFSTEQIAAMRANLQDEHSQYLQITEPLTEIPDDAVVTLSSPVDTQLVQYNNINLSWNPMPGATLYTVEIGLFSSFIPVLYTQTVYSTATAGLLSVAVTKTMPNNRVLYWRVHPYNEWDVCQPLDTFIMGVFKTQNLSATNDLEKALAAELSPNPVASGLPATLSIDSDQSMDALMFVTDMAGKKCLDKYIRISAGENEIEIPTGGLSAGAYIVTLQNEKGLVVKRLAVTQ